MPSRGCSGVPQSLVVGPQGVLDVVNMTGTIVKPFAGIDGVGGPVELQWVISFPWLLDVGKFQGETVHSIRPLTASELRVAA